MFSHPEIKITAQESLRDLQFQDWLHRIGVLDRPTELVDLSLKPNPQLKSDRTTSSVMYKVLADNAGYLVHRNEMAMRVFGEADPYSIHNLYSAAEVLSRNLEDPSLLFHSRSLGWGVGIRHFGLTPITLPIMYRLWRAQIGSVRVGDLTRAVYGVDDEHNRHWVVLHVKKLNREVLAGADFVVKHSGSLNSRYPVGDQVEFHLDRNHLSRQLERFLLLPHLQYPFQDWLASSRVNILKRRSTLQTERGFTIRQGESFGPVGSQLIPLLLEHIGYIIPLHILGYCIYGAEEKDYLSRLYALLESIKGKIKDPDCFSTFRNLGIGVGIEDFMLTTQGAMLLRNLWHRHEVAKSELIRVIYKDHSEDKNADFNRTLFEVRSALAGSEYEILTIRNGNKDAIGYTLRHVQNPA